MEGMFIDNNTIVCGIVCNRCGKTLPPHTVKRHLDINDPIHKCPHEKQEQVKCKKRKRKM